MTRENLIESARLLKQPSATAVQAFSEKREEMAAQVNQAMASRPDLEKLVGADGRRMSEDNNRNFSLFMASLLTHFHAEVIVDTALWVFRAYRAHGFDILYWPANLNAWMTCLKEKLPEKTFEEISPFYVWLITHIPVFVKLTDGAAGGENP